jgi:hypothetical protein
MMIPNDLPIFFTVEQAPTSSSLVKNWFGVSFKHIVGQELVWRFFQTLLEIH